MWRWWRKLGKRRMLRAADHLKEERRSVHLLNARPAVLYMADWEFNQWEDGLKEFFGALGHVPCVLAILTSWCREREEACAEMAKRVAGYRRRHRRHRVVMMANTEQEVEFFTRAGLEAVWFHHNANLSEETFRPLAEATREFDAIHNAQWAAYKRHELAAGVRNLALICIPTLGGAVPPRDDVRGMLAHACWLRSPFVEELRPRWTAEEINRALNRARTGLCLSAEEGGMYASTEYLLAGLPVVTTHNRGGRDVFFHADYVRWVGDDPQEVARAVEEVAREAPPPEEIRERTLVRIEEHRGRLREWLSREGVDMVVWKWPKHWSYAMTLGGILRKLQKA